MFRRRCRSRRPDLGHGRYVPASAIRSALDRLHAAVQAAVTQAANDAAQAITLNESSFTLAKEEVAQRLAEAGFDPGSDVEQRLTQLRDRLEIMEAKDRELRRLDSAIDAGLARLKVLHDDAHEARQALTRARRSTSADVNKAMRSFFARVDPNGMTERLDALIEDLATGTYMRAENRRQVRESLNRFRLLESAVRRRQGLGPTFGTDGQEQLIIEVLRRGRHPELAVLACMWPGDALELAQRTKDPTPFRDLTEGLRALAIKEISFAASDLPVITDQPEDAVPTRAVFESLVPTLREQRRRRQFVVVSHDANIVVASDVERVAVLQANPDGSAHAGDLFDDQVRAAALEHLEGGRRAFRLRADRYYALGEPLDAAP